MSALLVIGLACIALGVAVVQKLLVSEVEGWLPHVSQRLVDYAAQRLPQRDRERYREEWLAELNTFDDRQLTALLWSLDLLRGSRSLRLELARKITTDEVLVAQNTEPRITATYAHKRYTLQTRGLDRLDVYVDGVPIASFSELERSHMFVPPPSGCVEFRGVLDGELITSYRPRRRRPMPPAS
jgi:hypothetical protein